MTTSLRALCRAYAAHVGVPEPANGIELEVERRVSWWPLWARLGVSLSAAQMRWIAPLLVLGVPRRFESLSGDEKELLLASLQQSRWTLVRGAFMMVKTVVLGTCYSGKTS